MPYDFEFRIGVKAPRAAVFESLLRIENLSRWFCGWARIEPKVGGSFKFGGETCPFAPEGRGWSTTIDAGEPLKAFGFTWPIQGVPTRVAYALDDEAAGGTHLVARHVGVPTLDTTCGTVQDAWRMCLGNLKSISEGRTDSVRPDHAPPEGGRLRLTTLIEAGPPRVFEALTDPRQIDIWSTGGLPAGRARAEAHAGGAYAMGGPPGPDRVLEVAPDRRIVLGWHRGDADLAVDLTLEEKASGTAIYLVGTGYGADDAPGIVRDRGRWSDWFVCLRNFIEGGDAGFRNAYEDQVREA
jgi:uncharacterized protein YndB with AHSA1/START domain